MVGRGIAAPLGFDPWECTPKTNSRSQGGGHTTGCMLTRTIQRFQPLHCIGPTVHYQKTCSIECYLGPHNRPCQTASNSVSRESAKAWQTCRQTDGRTDRASVTSVAIATKQSQLRRRRVERFREPGSGIGDPRPPEWSKNRAPFGTGHQTNSRSWRQSMERTTNILQCTIWPYLII